MASRSARSRKKAPPAKQSGLEVAALGELFNRQRLAVGGLTAFAVAFSYVAANALWYQPHQHTGTFFATRAPAGAAMAARTPAEGVLPETMPEIETIIRLEEESPLPQARPDERHETAAPVPEATAQAPATEPANSGRSSGNEAVRAVQLVLAELKLYDGDIDGLMGPQTRAAVSSYQRTVGMPVTGEVDGQLLDALGHAGSTQTTVASIEPPARAPQAVEQARPAPAGTDSMSTASSGAASPTRQAAAPLAQGGDEMILRIQAGLKAFGNDGIDLDGRMGERTRVALLEFQSLFGLAQTGQPTREVYAKMREIGLTD